MMSPLNISSDLSLSVKEFITVLDILLLGSELRKTTELDP